MAAEGDDDDRWTPLAADEGEGEGDTKTLNFFDPDHTVGWQEKSSGHVEAGGSTLVWDEGYGYPLSCIALDTLIPVGRGHATLDDEAEDGKTTEDFRVLPQEARHNSHEGIRFSVEIGCEIACVGAVERKGFREHLREFNNSDGCWFRKTDGTIYAKQTKQNMELSKYAFKEESLIRVTLSYGRPKSGEGGEATESEPVAPGRLIVENMAAEPGKVASIVISEDLPPGCVPFVAIWNTGGTGVIKSIELLPSAGRLTKSARKR
jgi:hypothetical protein